MDTVVLIDTALGCEYNKEDIIQSGEKYCMISLVTFKISRNLVRLSKECRWLFVAFEFPMGFMHVAPEYAVSFFNRTQLMSQPRCTCSRRCFQGHASLRCDTVWQLLKEMWLALPSWCCTGKRQARVLPPMLQYYR
jgi:hypothetical protein